MPILGKSGLSNPVVFHYITTYVRSHVVAKDMDVILGCAYWCDPKISSGHYI